MSKLSITGLDFENINPKQKTEQGTDLSLQHSSAKLRDVVFEILHAHPERGFYFLNEGELRSRVQFLQEQFLPDSEIAKIAYAIKANPKKRILEIAREAGITDFDCASPEEIAHVLDIVPDARVLYNNPVKFQRQVHEASKMGVRHYTAQTKRGIEKIIQGSSPYDSEKSLEIAIRMKTLNDEAEIDLSPKFGTLTKRLRELVRFLVNETCTTPGIAVHTGSQNKSPEMFKQAIEMIGAVIKDIRELVIVNLGGGFPVNYHETDSYNLKEYFEAINRSVKETLHDLFVNQNAQIIIEPGRSVVADSIDLFIPVIELVEHEETGVKPGLFIDDGVFTSFSDSAIHRWKYAFQPFSIQGKKFAAEKVPMTVFGRTCDSGDVITEVPLPANIDEGDYLWVKSAGAYLDSQTTYFNGFKPHPYVYYNP